MPAPRRSTCVPPIGTIDGNEDGRPGGRPSLGIARSRARSASVAVVARACTARRRARRGTRPAPSLSFVSFTPSLPRCRRATFSSRCFGSVYTLARSVSWFVEQLDLRDHLVREAVRSSRSSGGPWRSRGSAGDPRPARSRAWPSGKHPAVDLRLDVRRSTPGQSWPGRPCRSRCRSGRCCRRSRCSSSAPCARR